MPPSRMLTSVLQTVLITTAGLIITHNLYASITSHFSTHEVYQNYTNTMALLANKTSNQNIYNITSTYTLPNGTTVTNATSMSFPPKNSTDEESQKSFYTSTLPREIFINFIISLISYKWHIFLERLLPARPRPKPVLNPTSISSNTNVNPESDDTHELAIIEKYLAQGKIRRNSLSWRNTFCKWVLDLVIGGLMIASVTYLLEGIMRWDTEPRELLKGMKWEVPTNALLPIFSPRPLCTLLSLMIIPAHSRIIFIAGMDTAIWTFFGLFANLIVPWFAGTEFGREFVANLTRNTVDVTKNNMAGGEGVRLEL